MTAVAFHVILAGVAVWLGYRAARPQRTRARHAEWFGALVLDLAVFLLCAVLLASTAGVLTGDLFVALRLLAQALFGELVVLAGAVAAAHAVAGDRLRAALPAALAAALVAVYWQAYHREPQQLVVRRHTLTLPRPSAAPRRLRIVHMTDIQTEDVGDHERRALRAALAERPDLLVMTGDYAITERAAADLRRLFQSHRLAAPLGVYAVPGDVPDDGPRLFRDLGVTWLDDRHAEIPLPGGGSLVLVGLGTATSRTRDTRALLRVVDAAPRGDLKIVMGHAPDFVAELAGRTSIDLALAGHTHGGQVVLPFLGPPLTLMRLPRRYAGDLHDYEGTPLHVSRGIGMERGAAPRVRFNCPPELCVLDLRH